MALTLEMNAGMPSADYLYVIGNEDGQEIVSHHWHPNGRGQRKDPHMHFGYAAEIGRKDLLTSVIVPQTIDFKTRFEASVTAVRGFLRQFFP